MSDRILEQAVRSALDHEAHINLDRIIVTVQGGVATLAGEVDNRTQKLTARYKAQCVRGVSDVHDELDVRVPSRVEQRVEDIATGVMNALFWDAAVPTNRVSAKCDKGWVTLTGEVDRAYQKSSAEADVRKIRGVIGVTNAIKIATGAERVSEPGRMSEGRDNSIWRERRPTAH